MERITSLQNLKIEGMGTISKTKILRNLEVLYSQGVRLMTNIPLDLVFPTTRSTVLTTSSQLAAQPQTVMGIEQPYAKSLTNWHLFSQYCL